MGGKSNSKMGFLSPGVWGGGRFFEDDEFASGHLPNATVLVYDP